MMKTWDLRILMRGILVWKIPHNMRSWQIDTACCKGLNAIIPYWWFCPCLSLHGLSLMKSIFYNRAIWIKLSSPNPTYQIKSPCLKPFQSLRILPDPGATVMRHIRKNIWCAKEGVFGIEYTCYCRPCSNCKLFCVCVLYMVIATCAQCRHELKSGLCIIPLLLQFLF